MFDLLIFSCIILPYMLFDVNYFLRTFFTITWDRLFHRRRNIFEHTIHYGEYLLKSYYSAFPNTNYALLKDKSVKTSYNLNMHI